MSDKKDRKIWQTPWGYPESAAVVGGVVVIGMILQIVAGEFDFYLLARPVNFTIGLLLIVLSVWLGIEARRSSIARWLSGVRISVTLILALLFLAIIMGLTPQKENSVSLLGFDAMTRSWPFVLVYLLTLLSLGALVVRRLSVFRWRDYAFYINHIGLWLLLAASGLGYADMERYIMHVREGETEWRVYDDAGNMRELPVAILLNDFDMDVYPPKLAVIDRNTGEVQPPGNPQYFQIDRDIPNGKLDGWNIEITEYIHNAVRSSDSTYREVPMPGATPAVKVSAARNNETIEGWICSGNQAQLYMTLPLTERYSMVMTVAEPRSFTSDIEVYTDSGEKRKTILEVNKPLRVGPWTVYQYGYDNNAGRLSSYSSFELVYDAWFVPVYIGIIMMMLGSVAMLLNGRNSKEGVRNDVE